MYENQSDVHFYFGIILTYTMHIHAAWPSLSFCFNERSIMS